MNEDKMPADWIAEQPRLEPIVSAMFDAACSVRQIQLSAPLIVAALDEALAPASDNDVYIRGAADERARFAAILGDPRVTGKEMIAITNKSLI